jgi:hypothetical protein
MAAAARLTLRIRLLQADAVVVENGGRIFYNDVEQLTPLTEDQGWRRTHATVIGSAFEVRHVRESWQPAWTPRPPLTDHFGMCMQTSQPVEQRKGALWDLYRDMKESHWAVDARSYTTEFRVRAPPHPTRPSDGLSSCFSRSA